MKKLLKHVKKVGRDIKKLNKKTKDEIKKARRSKSISHHLVKKRFE